MQKHSYFSNHKNHRILIAASAVAMLAGVSSCSDYDNGYDDKTLAYKESFIEAFGTIDPNHTWNMAQSCTVDVTINLPGVFTVKVWTADPRMQGTNSYLLGKYENVQGGSTQSFQCDIPSTVETAYVGAIDEDGNRFVVSADVKNGKVKATIGAEGSRLVLTENSTDAVPFSETEDYYVMSASQVLQPLERLPEKVNNTNKVSQNFEYYSQGPFTIYPMYSITTNTGSTGSGERIGIYIGDDYQNIIWVWQAKDWFEAYYPADGKWSGNGLYAPNFFQHLYDNKSFYDGTTLIRSKGVTVNLPVGTKFGFVIDTSSGNYYSNSSYNKDEGWPFTGSFTGTDGINDVYAATFEVGNQLYVAFEDWTYRSSGHDNDFNDLVFGFKDDANRPLIIDKDVEDVSMYYTVACEDLGGSFDWDFNDVVYGIEHVSGQTTARIKLLAAGGTLPVSISYKNTPITFASKKTTGSQTSDLHEAFGIDQKVPVNVGAQTADPVYSNDFAVDANFSMTNEGSNFRILVKYNGDNGDFMDIGVPSHTGKEPQAILVADPNWKWPNELQNITTKYPGFEDWVKNSLRDDWCGSSWGLSSNSTITEGTDLMDYVTWENNKARISFPAWALDSDCPPYTISVLTAKPATLSFYNKDGSMFKAMIDGRIEANKRTKITLSSDVVRIFYKNAEGGNENYMELVFDDPNCVAKANVIEFRNIKGQLGTDGGEEEQPEATANPGLTSTPSEIYIYGGNASGTASLKCTTASAGAISYTSNNTSVVTVDANGNITRVAPGKTYITIHQVAYGEYTEATVNVPVDVEGWPRTIAVYPKRQYAIVGQTTNWGYYENTTKQYDATLVTSSNSSVATGFIRNDSLIVAAHSFGKATLTITEPDKGIYYGGQVTVDINVPLFANFIKMGGNCEFYNTTGWYEWKASTWNLLDMFYLKAGYLSKCAGINITLWDVGPDEKCRIVLKDANDNVVHTFAITDSGAKQYWFADANLTEEQLNSVVTISFGGMSDKGGVSVSQSDCYMIF